MSEACGVLLFLYRRWLKQTKHAERLPEDVSNLFKRYMQPNNCSDEEAPFSGNNTRGIMPIERLCDFLKEQGMTPDKAQNAAQSIIASRNLKGFFNYRRNGLSYNGFIQQCLLSRHCNDPLAKMEFDEDAPLAHYFVYTSHTSYLRKTSSNTIIQKFNSFSMPDDECEQKSEKVVYSDEKAITKALNSGVRVITLDLLPLKPDAEDFEVQHPKYINLEDDQIIPGEKSYRFRRISPSLTLKKCLKAIKKDAFVATEFPLIIVLVKHFDESTSLLMEQIDEVFNREEELYDPDTALETPLKSLKNKFIILMKQGTASTLRANEDAEGNFVGYMENLNDDFQKLRTSGPGKPVKLNMTVDNLEKANGADILRFTQENKNLLAVYPDVEDPGITSNYDPSIGWTLGAQMVALSIQEQDKGLWIMQGLFRAQGKKNKITGYVKKPGILLNPEFDPTVWRPVKKILRVKVYMGTGWHLDFGKNKFDRSSPPDFFAAVEIVGVPADEAKEKTVPIMDQWVPVWDQGFEFPLTVPELAMLVIEVKEFDPDRTHDFGGQNCLPVSQLKNGFRSVPLYNQKGKNLRSAKLLMHFQLD